MEDAFEQEWNPAVGPVVVPISDNLSVLEKSIMAEVVGEFHELFDGSLGLAPTSFLEHCIDTDVSKPISCPPRRVSTSERSLIADSVS